ILSHQSTIALLVLPRHVPSNNASIDSSNSNWRVGEGGAAAAAASFPASPQHRNQLIAEWMITTHCKPSHNSPFAGLAGEGTGLAGEGVGSGSGASALIAHYTHSLVT